MTTTKLAYLVAVLVPGGFLLLALALAVRLFMRRDATGPAAR